MHRISIKFMQHMLADEQKENYVNIRQELCGHASIDEHFLN